MKPLVLVPQYFGALVFDRRSSRYHPFDHESARLLARTADVGLDASLAELEPERQESATAFCEHFFDQGYFTVAGRFAGERLRVEPPPDHLTGPLAVHLEVIAACNLACGHCFAGDLPRRALPLGLGELDALFADLASVGSFRLGLTGGEPLMRRDLLDVVDAALAHGLHPCLTTNALLLDERWARELGRRFVWLNVSLDGATAETNDRVRGPGTYDRVRAKLELLREHARFTLAFTLMRHNVSEIEACAKLARDVGAHTAVFRPLYPVGVARRNLAWMPEFEEYASALRRLEAALGPDGNLHAVDPFSPQRREVVRGKTVRGHGCGAGTTIASIGVDGRVSPCSFLGAEVEGASVRERPFRAIWDEGHHFRRLRVLGEGPEEFRGGCRARAQVLAGGLDRADPWETAWRLGGGHAPDENLEWQAP